MGGIVVTILGDVIKITYPAGEGIWSKYTKNKTNGRYVGMYHTTGKIGSNILCDESADMEYNFSQFDSIDTNPLADNDALFTQLENLL